MVEGLLRFTEHFRGFEKAYAVIGGAACEQLFRQNAVTFRVTHDVDIVLILESLDDAFLRRFWEFIRAGKYQTRQKSSSYRECYRFLHPEEDGFPEAIELFSRRLDRLELEAGQQITPIPAGEDVSSLSAILIDDDYYGLIRDTARLVEGLPVVDVHGLIPLKAKAWLDLTRRQRQGEQVHTRDLRKHRNDVFRLVPLLTIAAPPLPAAIQKDLQSFVDVFPATSPEWPAILNSIHDSYPQLTGADGVIRQLCLHYQLLAPAAGTRQDTV